jgi:hypothetical protein
LRDAATGEPSSVDLTSATVHAIDGNDNVWVANNWDMPAQAGFKKVPPPALSTRFGGNSGTRR